MNQNKIKKNDINSHLKKIITYVVQNKTNQICIKENTFAWIIQQAPKLEKP